jgi:hypothetical protein
VFLAHGNSDSTCKILEADGENNCGFYIVEANAKSTPPSQCGRNFYRIPDPTSLLYSLLAGRLDV